MQQRVDVRIGKVIKSDQELLDLCLTKGAMSVAGLAIVDEGVFPSFFCQIPSQELDAGSLSTPPECMIQTAGRKRPSQQIRECVSMYRLHCDAV